MLPPPPDPAHCPCVCPRPRWAARSQVRLMQLQELQEWWGGRAECRPSDVLLLLNPRPGPLRQLQEELAKGARVREPGGAARGPRERRYSRAGRPPWCWCTAAPARSPTCSTFCRWRAACPWQSLTGEDSSCDHRAPTPPGSPQGAPRTMVKCKHHLGPQVITSHLRDRWDPPYLRAEHSQGQRDYGASPGSHSRDDPAGG